MYGLLLAFHVLVCFGLVMVILLQSGKGGGLAGGAFGGTAQTVFGGRGATDFLTRATMVLAACFFLSSIALAMLSTGTRGAARSLLQEQARKTLPSTPQQAPQQPPQQAPSQAPQPTPQQNPTPAPSGGNQTPKAPPSGGH